MARYVALLDGVEGAYGMIVPDLSGCTAAGATIAEAVTDAIGALREWILDARANADAVPPPRDMAALKADKDVAGSPRDGAAFVMIPRLGIQVNGHLICRISSRKSVSQLAFFLRVLTLPADLLARTRPRPKRRTMAMFLAPSPDR